MPSTARAIQLNFGQAHPGRFLFALDRAAGSSAACHGITTSFRAFSSFYYCLSLFFPPFSFYFKSIGPLLVQLEAIQDAISHFPCFLARLCCFLCSYLCQFLFVFHVCTFPKFYKLTAFIFLFFNFFWSLELAGPPLGCSAAIARSGSLRPTYFFISL